MTPPSLKPELEDLVRTSLAKSYMSESPFQATLTTNSYQTLALTGLDTPGFRSSRAAFLDAVNFQGARVLDLGSNLGEISRGARERGARLVDGYEYDPFFVEVASAVNVLRDTTRTSFFRRDITRSDVYVEPYDIVIAFSVFVYIKDVLGDIAARTNGILLFETHRLEGNLDATYVEPIRRHFPAWRLIGNSEWGTQHDPADQRAVIAFAENDQLLDRYLKPQDMITSG